LIDLARTRYAAKPAKSASIATVAKMASGVLKSLIDSKSQHLPCAMAAMSMAAESRTPKASGARIMTINEIELFL